MQIVYVGRIEATQKILRLSKLAAAISPEASKMPLPVISKIRISTL